MCRTKSCSNWPNICHGGKKYNCLPSFPWFWTEIWNEVVKIPGKKWLGASFRGDRKQTLERLCYGARRSCSSAGCRVPADVQDRASCVRWGLHPDKAPSPQRKLHHAAAEAGTAAEVGTGWRDGARDTSGGGGSTEAKYEVNTVFILDFVSLS